MRSRAIAALGAALWLLIGACASAVAATSFPMGTNCNAGITHSNGDLTLTAASTNAYKQCYANVAKWAGPVSQVGTSLWYFECTIDAPISSLGCGVAVNGTGSPIDGAPSINGAPSTSVGNNIGTDSYAVIAYMPQGWWFYVNQHITFSTPANGNTIGFAWDLNANPPQAWVTNYADGLVCDGNGNAGATNPKWNGSCANDPSIPGTGKIAASLPGITFPGYAIVPAFNAFNADKATFNFGASAFVGSLSYLPAGYQAWDTAGAGAPNPGPTNPVTSNIANAPGWVASTNYASGSRVVAGPGWTPGSPGSYTSGQPLYLWALSGAGGTSGSSPPGGFSSCASPAGVGGGLNGIAPAGWSGATAVSDNGLTWVCLTVVDYVTITGFTVDSAANWTSGNAYFYNDWVISAGGAYMMTTSETVSPFTCTAGATPPTGTTLGTAYSDGNCNWTYQGPLTYSSKANSWPHMQYPRGSSAFATGGRNWSITAQVWWGGFARQTYTPGQNGEAQPILIWRHDADYLNDSNTNCYSGWQNGQSVNETGIGGPNSTGCAGRASWYGTTFTVASGDSIFDNVTPGSGPLVADSAKGVMLKSTTSYSPPGSAYSTAGEPVAFSESGLTITRFQIVSTAGPALPGTGQNGPGAQHWNTAHITKNIIDANGGIRGLAIDAGMVLDNNLIIWRSTLSGSAAIWAKYPDVFFNNTIVCNGGTNVTGIQANTTGAGLFSFGGALSPPPWKNNNIFSCPNPWAFGTSWPSTNGANNATDVSGSFIGGSFTASDGSTLTSAMFPGVGSTCTPPGNSSSCDGLTTANQFVNPSLSSGTDFRVKSASADIYNGGATFSFATNGSNYGTLSPGSDIFNTSRPTAGRYDIGAEQFVAPPEVRGFPKMMMSLPGN